MNDKGCSNVEPMLKMDLPDEAATVSAGYCLAQAIARDVVNDHICISLEGELGAGKTTFSRGVLTGLGHSGRVKSPTYTLVEPYELNEILAYHFDLYRLADPEELEFVGIRDYFSGPGVSLVEWYERGKGIMPTPDIVISLSLRGNGRELQATACSPRARQLLHSMNDVAEN